MVLVGWMAGPAARCVIREYLRSVVGWVVLGWCGMRLKKLSAVLALSALFALVGRGQAALPRNYQEFKAHYQQAGRRRCGEAVPEVVFCYIDEATRAERLEDGALRPALRQAY